jgi:hypothetical protein
VNKHGPVLDVVGKRYKIRPSVMMGLDQEYSPYYCMQFDIATAIKGIITESKAQEKAMADAKNKGSDDLSEEGNTLDDNPAFTPEGREAIKKASSKVTSELTQGGKGDPKKINPTEIMKKINNFHGKRNRPT